MITRSTSFARQADRRLAVVPRCSQALLGRTCHARVVEEADGVQPQVRARPDLAQQELRAVAPAHDQHALRGKRPARQVTHDAPRGEDRG